MTVRCPYCDATINATANPATGLIICSSCGQVLRAPQQGSQNAPPARPPAPRTQARRAGPQPAKATPTAILPSGKGHTLIEPASPTPLPAQPAPAKTRVEPASPRPPLPVNAAAPPVGPGKTSSVTGPGSKRKSGQGSGTVIPLLESMDLPAGPGLRRWVTLTCLVLSVAVLAGSAALAAWQLRHRPTARPTQTVAESPKEPPVKAAEERPAPSPGGGPSAPVGGSEALCGGIEIGSKGVKAVVVRPRPAGDGGPSFELAAAPLTANPTLVAGLQETGMFAPQALRDTAQVVARFCKRFRDEYQVADEHISVVASSGLLDSIKNRSDLLETNKRELAEAVRKAAGKEMTFLDVAGELELTFRGTVPAEHIDDSLLIDIGSGSTKASCSEAGGSRLIPVSIPYGTVSFAEEVDRRVRDEGGTFAAQIDPVLKDSEKMEQLREAVKRSPALANQKRIYLVGGLAWAVAAFRRPGERGDLVALSAADLEAFAAMLEKASAGRLPEPDLKSISDESVRDEARNEFKDVCKKFSRDQLLGGTRLLQALLGEFGGADREMLFARQGYLGLAIGSALQAKDRKP